MVLPLASAEGRGMMADRPSGICPALVQAVASLRRRPQKLNRPRALTNNVSAAGVDTERKPPVLPGDR